MRRLSSLKLLALLLPLAMILAACPSPMGTADLVVSGAPNISPGATSTSVTQNVKSTDIIVLDSANGSPLYGAAISIYVEGALVETINLGANEYIVPDYEFESGLAYDIVARKADRASARFQGYVSNSGYSEITLYCQALGILDRPAEAPLIASISLSLSNGQTMEAYDFLPVPKGFLRAVTVTLTGRSSVEPTSWSGEGIKLGINYMPSLFDGITPTYIYKGVDVGAGDYETKTVFEIPYASMRDGRNELILVGYDVANNRVERRLIIDILDSATSEEFSQEAEGVIQDPFVSLTTYGYSRSYFGIGTVPFAATVTDVAPDAMEDPVTGEPISYRAKISFSYEENGQDTAIDGYEIWRAADDGDYARIARYYYTAPTDGTHTYYDVDPSLEFGVLYSYKVKAYLGSSISGFSDVAQAQFIKSFRTSLDGAYSSNWFDSAEETGIIGTKSVNLEFMVSDNTILNTASPIADEFGFLMVIKDKSGQYLSYLDFLYDVTNRLGNGTGVFYYRGVNGSTWYKTNSVDKWNSRYIDIYTGNFGISHTPGVTYEWNIYGRYLGAGSFAQSPGMSPSYLKKYFTNGEAVSYSDIYQNGNDTSNGWFSYTIADDAD